MSKNENFFLALLMGGFSLITIILLSLYITTRQNIKFQNNINKQLNDIKIELININKQVKQNKDNIEKINRKVEKISKDVNKLNDQFNKFNKSINNISMIIKSVNKKIDDKTAYAIAYNIIDASSKYDVPVEYIISVMWVESHFNPYAYNEKTGCIGLMQINPDTWLKLRNEDLHILLFNIRTNIMAGAYILKYYYNKYGNWRDAIIAYYGISPYAKKYYVKNVSWRVEWIRKKIKT